MEMNQPAVTLDPDSLTGGEFAKELLSTLLDGHPTGLTEESLSRAWDQWCELVTGAVIVQMVTDGNIAIGCDEEGNLLFRVDEEGSEGDQDGDDRPGLHLV